MLFWPNFFSYPRSLPFMYNLIFIRFFVLPSIDFLLLATVDGQHQKSQGGEPHLPYHTLTNVPGTSQLNHDKSLHHSNPHTSITNIPTPQAKKSIVNLGGGTSDRRQRTDILKNKKRNYLPTSPPFPTSQKSVSSPPPFLMSPSFFALLLVPFLLLLVSSHPRRSRNGISKLSRS
jgi:hypothetical protein